VEEYLKPGYFVDSGHPSIVDRAHSLTQTYEGDREKAVALFDFVRDAIAYNPYGPAKEKERYKASATLARGYGYCIQKAVLLTALLRAVSIPAALVFADIRNPLIPDNLKRVLKTNDFVYHCYNNIFVNGSWLKATCAFDSAMCAKLNIPVVRFDGTRDAVFPPITSDGRPFVVYLRHRGISADIPFEEVMHEFESFYGEEVLSALERGRSVLAEFDSQA